MKKKSIKQKVSSLTIKISLLSVIMIGIITISGLLILRQNTIKVGSDLGEMAAGDSQHALEEGMTDRLITLAKNKASLSDATLRLIQNSVEMIAYNAENILHNPEKYNRNPVDTPDAKNKDVITAQFMSANGVELSDITDEAALMGNIQDILLNVIINNVGATSDYLGSESGYIIIVDNASDKKTEHFDPRERPWYMLAKENNGLSWTDVYSDSYGRGLAITCAKPYYDNKGDIAGVVGVGTLLDELMRIVIDTKVGETGYAFILNEMGQIIISEGLSEDSEGHIIRDDLLNSSNSEMSKAVRNIISSKNGIDKVTIDNKEYFMAHAALETRPWSLVTVMDVGEAIAPAMESKERIINLKNNALSDINFIIIIVISAFIMALGVIILFIGYISKRFATTITYPITVLQEGVSLIANGNLEYTLDIHTGDEIEDLGLSVNKMTLDLKAYISNLSKIMIEKERINSDLRIATDIQSDMLPKIFPPFSNRSDLHIMPFMLPAKEVGGDFYDFFFLDDEQKKIALVIADVSGKGVPAALFMVIAKVLIKNNKDLPCDEILGTVNNLLAADNNSSMFVTTFFSVLDLETGEYNYTSAGHNPPLLYRCESRELTYLSLPRTPPLAIFQGKQFESQNIMLHRGDALLLYTDGVTEAFNTQSEMYGSERLLQNLMPIIDKPVEKIVEKLYASIQEFAGDEPQSDDITMLCCRFFGKGIEM